MGDSSGVSGYRLAMVGSELLACAGSMGVQYVKSRETVLDIVFKSGLSMLISSG